MTKEEFKANREALGFTQKSLGELWNMGKWGGRTIRGWEAGDRPVNTIAAHSILMMMRVRALGEQTGIPTVTDKPVGDPQGAGPDIALAS